MSIHIGKKIKEELYRQGVSVTEFAKKINRSRNVVYDIFERESIDTELLNKISRILNCNFFSLYTIQKEYTMHEVKHYMVNEPLPQYGRPEDEVKLLQQQIEALQSEVAYLKKIIALLEDRKHGKNT